MRLPRRRSGRPARAPTVAEDHAVPGDAGRPIAAPAVAEDHAVRGDAGRAQRLLDDVAAARAELDTAVAELRRRAQGPTYARAESDAAARGRALDTAIVTAIFDAARPTAGDIADRAGVDPEYVAAIRARLGA